MSFQYAGSHLFIQLPSGRKLSYVEPRIGENKFGGESIQYMGVGATKKWELLESYGPKFVENIIQAIPRDILCIILSHLEFRRSDWLVPFQAGFPPTLKVLYILGNRILM